MAKALVEGLLVTKTEWNKLSKVQQQFIREAEAGHFCYMAENGEVMAWGAEGTGNLFTVPVREEKKESESLYFLED